MQTAAEYLSLSTVDKNVYLLSFSQQALCSLVKKLQSQKNVNERNKYSLRIHFFCDVTPCQWVSAYGRFGSL